MSYFENNRKENCNGCGICSIKCPQNAIEMITDYEGFEYPVINKNKCINCGICKKICPNHKHNKNLNIKAYIAINRNNKELKQSSSGGIFILLAKYVLNKNGVVFGAIYDKKLNVVHSYTNSIENINKFQGSKYVRSNIYYSYQKVKEFLENNKLVLFTGTPCQCAGLRAYIGNNKNLITCEIICHSNPSPKIFTLYKNNLEKIYNKKIINILFRNKKNGWNSSDTTIVFDDGMEIKENTFYQAFGNELINRPSCHNCYFCSSNRLSDFTIGDMWGIQKIDSTVKNDNTGISLLTVNTKNGEEILERIKEELFIKPVDIEKAFNYNHHCNSWKNSHRNIIFKKIKSGEINEDNIIENLRKYSNISVFTKIIRKFKKIINYR